MVILHDVSRRSTRVSWRVLGTRSSLSKRVPLHRTWRDPERHKEKVLMTNQPDYTSVRQVPQEICSVSAALGRRDVVGQARELLYFGTAAHFEGGGEAVWTTAFAHYVEELPSNLSIRKDARRIRLQLVIGDPPTVLYWTLEFALEVEENASHAEVRRAARRIRARLEALQIPREAAYDG